jgi:hypothetical protein
MREAYTLMETDRDHMVVYNRLGTICSSLGRHYEAEGCVWVTPQLAHAPRLAHEPCWTPSSPARLVVVIAVVLVWYAFLTVTAAVLVLCGAPCLCPGTTSTPCCMHVVWRVTSPRRTCGTLLSSTIWRYVCDVESDVGALMHPCPSLLVPTTPPPPRLLPNYM